MQSTLSANALARLEGECPRQVIRSLRSATDTAVRLTAEVAALGGQARLCSPR